MGLWYILSFELYQLSLTIFLKNRTLTFWDKFLQYVTLIFLLKVCSPWILRKKRNCLIYSLGVDRDVTFEREMNLVTGGSCEIHLFDLVPQDEEIFKSFSGKFSIVFF